MAYDSIHTSPDGFFTSFDSFSSESIKKCCSDYFTILEGTRVPAGHIAMIRFSKDGTCKLDSTRKMTNKDVIRTFRKDLGDYGPVQGDSVFMSMAALLPALSRFKGGLSIPSATDDLEKEYETLVQVWEVVMRLKGFFDDEDNIKKGGQQVKNEVKKILNNLP